MLKYLRSNVKLQFSNLRCVNRFCVGLKYKLDYYSKVRLYLRIMTHSGNSATYLFTGSLLLLIQVNGLEGVFAAIINIYDYDYDVSQQATAAVK